MSPVKLTTSRSYWNAWTIIIGCVASTRPVSLKGISRCYPLLDVNGYHVNIRWIREIQDSTEQKILDWATRFGLEHGHGHGDDVEWEALHPFQMTNIQRKLLINYIGAY
jgi:hypothetical protein